MATTMIANLNPGDGDKPLEIKVIGKWLSFGRKVECCYVFLDKSGDAIGACSSFSERAYFDSIISVGSCYSLDNYMCEKEKTYFVSVPHKTRIKLGKAAKVEQIPGDDFPVNYFSLLAYNQLNSRLDDHSMLTDYIGKVEDAYKVSTDQGTKRLKLKLENQREKMIEATIWDDSALSFDIEALEALPAPVIVVVTSMKVTQYLGILQLTATPATFVARDAQNPTLKIKYQKSKDEETEKQRNRFTLAAMLSQNPKRYEELSSLAKPLWFASMQVKDGFIKHAINVEKSFKQEETHLPVKITNKCQNQKIYLSIGRPVKKQKKDIGAEEENKKTHVGSR